MKLLKKTIKKTNILPENVLHFEKASSKYLCAVKNNTYSIEFTQLRIIKIETDFTFFFLKKTSLIQRKWPKYFCKDQLLMQILNVQFPTRIVQNEEFWCHSKVSVKLKSESDEGVLHDAWLSATTTKTDCWRALTSTLGSALPSHATHASKYTISPPWTTNQ